jgi:hypothetical protein
MDGLPENIRHRPATLSEVLEPWEAAGESRHDCLPHRSGLLHFLARLGLCAGGLSVPFFLPFLPGLALACLVRHLARRDLDLMSRGDMDQRGYQGTVRAFSEAKTALLLSIVGPLLWIVVSGIAVLSLALRHHR